MRERRPLFTSVRRAILRVAFLADLVLAIWIPSVEFRRGAMRETLFGRSRQLKKQRRRAGARRLIGLHIGQPGHGRQRPPRPWKNTGFNIGLAPLSRPQATFLART